MTILGLRGSEEEAKAVLRGLSLDRTARSERDFRLARNGLGTDAHIDSEIRVVSEGHSAAAIAVAYRRHGLGCVRHLDGAFSFVLNDGVNELLLAASDLLSRRPLAYWLDGSNLVVSSRLLRVLEHPLVPRALDDLYLAHLVTGFWSAPPGTTPFRAVKRLPAGVALVARKDQVQLVPLDRLRPTGPVNRSKSSWVDGFWTELDGAILRSRASGSTCLSLSGGLDSAVLGSSIVRLATEAPPVAAFSMVAPSRGIDESEAIRELERAYAGHVASSRVDCSDAVDISVVDAFALQDDPAMTPLAYLPSRLRLWRAAQRAGFRTVLDGEGGDELFGMMCGPRDALLQGQWLAAWRFLRGHPARRAVLARSFALPAGPAWLRREWTHRQGRRGERLPSYLSDRARTHPAVEAASVQFFESQIGDDRVGILHDWLSNPSVVGPAATHRHLAAEHGLSLESPFLDRRVVEFVLGIPAEWMLSTEYKGFLRNAAVGRVPEGVRSQPKNHSFPLAYLREIVGGEGGRAVLREPRVRERLGEWIRFERLDGMLDRIVRGYEPRDPLVWQQLEGLVAFAYWYARAAREHGVT